MEVVVISASELVCISFIVGMLVGFFIVFAAKAFLDWDWKNSEEIVTLPDGTKEVRHWLD